MIIIHRFVDKEKDVLNNNTSFCIRKAVYFDLNRTRLNKIALPQQILRLRLQNKYTRIFRQKQQYQELRKVT